MIRWIKDWWQYNDHYILGAVIAVIGIVFGAFCLVYFAGGSMSATQYKYNCNLDRKPSLHTAFFIDDSIYAYDPKLFCDTLKEKMAKE